MISHDPTNWPNELQYALDFARRMHGKQEYQPHRMYTYHLIQVTLEVDCMKSKYDAELLTASILHDVVEDTPVTIQDISKLFGGRVAEIVFDLTHLDGESYDDQVLRAARRPDPWLIKWCDVAMNQFNCSELAKTDKKRAARLEAKYLKAMNILMINRPIGAEYA